MPPGHAAGRSPFSLLREPEEPAEPGGLSLRLAKMEPPSQLPPEGPSAKAKKKVRRVWKTDCLANAQYFSITG